ncbi:hypothetical protein DL93DRAFT_2083171 [Clavulina sp. PMI_390]|nr:hypothetical protein DL93DRAFT_2083171 [Clavulina sp. PMI_390]
MHLQADRTLELHTQGGLHHRTRIPKFGRCLAYSYPSCDALVGASGSDVYRLNLDQGRFLSPLELNNGGSEDRVGAVNCIDVNPAHQLWAFGTEGSDSSGGGGTVEFWDPRSRSRLASLSMPWTSLSGASSLATSMPSALTSASSSPAVTALASRSDGLSLAVGTSTGHTLLYDLRSPRSYATKDQGYGLPIKHVGWVEGSGAKMAGDGGLVVSADRKVIKVWNRNEPQSNFASITPATDVNSVHHLPGTGMLMTANEGIQMTSYYIPQLGPAPRWCTFLDNITEEMEGDNVRNVYDDFKFVDRAEVDSLGLSHLVGTPALKPYMHGYFMALKLYDAARVIANPHAYAEARERVISDKMAKLADSRIRAAKGAGGKDGLPKVNRALAEKVLREEERERRKEAKRAARKAAATTEAGAGEEDAMEVDGDGEDKPAPKQSEKKSILTDDRFKALFENSAFQVDESSREYALLNPASVGVGRASGTIGASSSLGKRKTAVEEEEEESDRPSSDGLGESSPESGDDDDGGDSSDEGELISYNPRARQPDGELDSAPISSSFLSSNQKSQPQSFTSTKSPVVRQQPKLAPARPSNALSSSSGRGSARDKEAAFGERVPRSAGSSASASGSVSAKGKSSDHAMYLPGGGVEVSWVPSQNGGAGDDSIFDDGRGIDQLARRKEKNGSSGNGGGKVERFGAGMERGGSGRGGRGDAVGEDGDEGDGRKGRTKRRTNVRSGSRNTFRAM